MTGTNELVSASLLVVAAVALLVYGIEQSAWVAVICTAVELLGLAIIIAVGVPKLGTIDYLETAETGRVGILTAAALIFFAYIGFEEIVQLAEETRDPSKTIPRAVILSIIVTTILYTSSLRFAPCPFWGGSSLLHPSRHWQTWRPMRSGIRRL